MDLADEFRTRAQGCLQRAHDAPSIESQTHWLSMAQLWHKMAGYADEQDTRLVQRAIADALKSGKGQAGDA